MATTAQVSSSHRRSAAGPLFSRTALSARGGAIHFLPADYALPPLTPSLAWQLWCCGVPTLRYQPFMFLKRREFSKGSDTDYKRFSDLRTLCLALQAAAVAANMWVCPASILQVNNMFRAALPALGILCPVGSEEERVSRFMQLTFLTVVRKLRTKRKADKLLHEGDGDGEDNEPGVAAE